MKLMIEGLRKYEGNYVCLLLVTYKFMGKQRSKLNLYNTIIRTFYDVMLVL